ncbi:MAG: DUF47 domain-containing protein [Ignavibacteriae bacterium]|nr:DUF47 domain-containing protein [Ignavibacteriota bacterium]
MKFDRFFKVLLPHDDKFYMFLERSTQNLLRASELLTAIPQKSKAERESIVRQIQDLEHEGDSITHEIFSELNRTFITPFDREDIHLLTSALDDVLDFLNGSATRFVLYKLKECPPNMVKLIDILDRSVGELHRGVSFIRNLNKPEQLHQVLQKVNEYENQADEVFETAIAELFEHEKDPINIIKLKEIYVGLETATDKCEDAANVLEALLIKHA